jgi:hypothetical protein
LLATPPDSDAPKVVAEESSVEWMDQGDAQPISDETPGWADEEAVAESDTPDWMAHPTTEEPAVMDFEEDAVAEADVPDWLSGSGFADDQPVSDDEEAFGGEIVAEDDSLDWSSEITFGDDDEAVATDEVNADTPDWLSSGFVDAETSDEDEAVAEEDAPDWLSGETIDEKAYANDEVEADAPDWLSGVSADEEVVEEEDAPDWLASSGDDEEEAVAEADAPDWLSDMTFGDEETAEEVIDEEEQFEEAVAEADAPDWLSDMSLEDDEAQPAAEEDEEALDWMSELEAASSPTASTEFVDQPEDLSWTDEEEAVEDDQPLISQGKTDWLSSVGISKRETTEPQAEDFGSDYSWADDEEEQAVEADASSDMPSWAVQESGSGTDSEFDWANELNNDETPTKALRSDAEEESVNEDYASVNANNAPDWLNAMVPGLDVDPEEEEDAPIEQSYSEDNGGHRVRAAADQSGFNWLTDIVDEETSAQPAAAPSMMPEELPTAPAPKPTKQPRFSFSRLPAWLRPKSAAPAAVAPAPAVTPTSVTEEPDWLREAEDTGDNSDNNDDFDMPDWLK